MTRNVIIALVVVGIVAGVVLVLVWRSGSLSPGRWFEGPPQGAGVDPVTGRAWQTIAEYEASQAVRG